MTTTRAALKRVEAWLDERRQTPHERLYPYADAKATYADLRALVAAARRVEEYKRLLKVANKSMRIALRLRPKRQR